MKYLFNQIQFDTETGLLQKDGLETQLAVKTAELLTCFLENPQTILSKEHLFQRIWPDQIVTDSAVFRLIRELRQALQVLDSDAEFITTLSKRGYRWETAAKQLAHDQSALKPDIHPDIQSTLKTRIPGKWLALFLIMATALSFFFFFYPKSTQPLNKNQVLAVAPFINQTQDQRYHWVQLGLMDMFNVILDRQKNLSTIETQALLSLQKQPAERLKDLNYQTQMCQQLGCTYFIHTQIKRDQGEFRVEISLTNIATQSTDQLISQDKDLILAANHAALSLLQFLDIPSTEPPDLRQHFSDNPQVNATYAMGVQEMSIGSFDTAKRLFEVCVIKNPDFVWAKIKLTESLEKLGQYDQAELQASQLLADNKNSPAQHLSILNILADIAFARGELEASVSISQDILKVAESAQMLYEQARQNHNIGQTLTGLGSFDEAEDKLKQALMLYTKIAYQPGIANSYFNLANLYNDQKQTDKARKYFSQARDLYQSLGNALYSLYADWSLLSLETHSEIERHEKRLLKMKAQATELGDVFVQALADNALAKTALSQNKPEQALKLIEARFQEVTANQNAYLRQSLILTYARTLLVLRQTRKAASLLNEPSSWNTDDVGPEHNQYLLAHVAYQDKNFEQAQLLMAKLKQNPPNWWQDVHENEFKMMQDSLDSGKISGQYAGPGITEP